MADPISGFVTWLATSISSSVGGFVASVTGSTALGGAVSTAVYYGTTFAVYAGLSLAATPRVPAPETGFISFKQSRPSRRRGYGEYRISGPAALWEAKDNFSYCVFCLHDGEIDSFIDYYLHDDLVTLTGDIVNELDDHRYAEPAVHLFTRLGLPTETAYSEIYTPGVPGHGGQTVPFTATRVSPGLPGIWTSNHRLDGIASICLIAYHGALDKVSTVFPNGEPKPSAVIRAQKVYDPRDGGQSPSNSATWLWSDNPALCLLHFLFYDQGHAYDWSVDEVPTFNAAKWARRFAPTLSLWEAAADVCDEEVELADTGSPADTEKRYRMGGFYETTNDPSAVINQMLICFDGWLATDGQGAFRVYAGQFSAPVVTLTDAEVRGFTCQVGVEREQAVNEIVVSFTDPAKKYNEVEAEPWVDQDDIDERGETLTEQLSLPWVQSNGQARRLAKRRMARHRAPCRGTLDCNFGARNILGQRYVMLDIASGPDILQGIAVEITKVRIDLNSFGLSADYIAVDETLLDGWTPATDEGEPPPTPDPVEPEPLAVPTIDAVEIVYEPTGTGFDNAHLNLTVTGEARAETWEIRTRIAGTVAWAVSGATDVDPTGDVELVTVSLAGNQTWEVAVRFITGGGSSSDWSATETVVIAAGDSEAILDEDGSPILDEDGLIIYDEGTV